MNVLRYLLGIFAVLLVVVLLIALPGSLSKALADTPDHLRISVVVGTILPIIVALIVAIACFKGKKKVAVIEEKETTKEGE